MAHNDELDSKLLGTGDCVARLDWAEPPADLKARTMARVTAQCNARLKQTRLLLRPITNPFARVAAAAVIIFTLAPMTDLDTADALGTRIEQKIGPAMTNHIERFVDKLLLASGTEVYSQSELDAFMGIQRYSYANNRRNTNKS